MRANRKKLKNTRLATNKSPGQAAISKQLKDGINSDDFSRFENEGGSNGSTPGILAVKIPSQPENPGSIPPVQGGD